jgi:hypothetical protein
LPQLAVFLAFGALAGSALQMLVQLPPYEAGAASAPSSWS